MSFNKQILCPWCNKGRVLGTETTTGEVSEKCNKCGKYYIADFGRMKAFKSNAIKQ